MEDLLNNTRERIKETEEVEGIRIEGTGEEIKEEAEEIGSEIRSGEGASEEIKEEAEETREETREEQSERVKEEIKEEKKGIRCEACDRDFKDETALAMHNSAKHPKKEKPKISIHKKPLFLIIGALLLTGFIGYFFMGEGNAASSGQHDEFARYLTEQGVIMYGSEWCSHCKSQKKAFGDSFQYVNYVDCDKNREACNDAGISGYPTWKINGENYPGQQSIESLMQLSGYQKFGSSSATKKEADAAKETITSGAGVQKINLGFKNNYYPNTITVEAGKPVEITLDSSVRGCFRSFNIKELGVSVYSVSPSDTIKFTPEKKGSFEFACGMRMGYGTIIIK